MEIELQYFKKGLITTSSTTPTSQDQITLHTDASDFGVGAVLSVLKEGERMKNTQWPTLSDTPAKGDKICSYREGRLAIVNAVEYFPIYLVADHKALEFLNTARHTNGRLPRWGLNSNHFHSTSITGPASCTLIRFSFRGGGGAGGRDCPPWNLFDPLE